MTDAPKKRPWLQYHLSTLIVLTFVAAGLLWLNMRPWHVRIVVVQFDVFGAKQPYLYVYTETREGWPSTASSTYPPLQPDVAILRPPFNDRQWQEFHRLPIANTAPGESVVLDEAAFIRYAPSLAPWLVELSRSNDEEPWWRWSSGAVAINATIALSILLAVALLCERRIRLKERRP